MADTSFGAGRTKGRGRERPAPRISAPVTRDAEIQRGRPPWKMAPGRLQDVPSAPRGQRRSVSGMFPRSAPASCRLVGWTCTWRRERSGSSPAPSSGRAGAGPPATRRGRSRRSSPPPPGTPRWWRARRRCSPRRPPSATSEVVERLRGDATTDFGAPSIALEADRRDLGSRELVRLQALLEHCWGALDRAAASAEGARAPEGPARRRTGARRDPGARRGRRGRLRAPHRRPGRPAGRGRSGRRRARGPHRDPGGHGPGGPRGVAGGGAARRRDLARHATSSGARRGTPSITRGRSRTGCPCDSR